jgi:hypothetical protein
MGNTSTAVETNRGYMRRYVREEGSRTRRGLVVAWHDQSLLEGVLYDWIDVGFSLKSSKDLDWNPITAEDFAVERLRRNPMVFGITKSSDPRGAWRLTSPWENEFNMYMDHNFPDMNQESLRLLRNAVGSALMDILQKPNRGCNVPLEALGVK